MSDSSSLVTRILGSAVLRWTATAAWAGVIFLGSSMPGSTLPGGYSTQAHFTEYAILGLLAYLALRLHASPVRSAILAVAIASLYGVTDEVHQMFVPLRYPDVRDWAVDTMGAAVACTAAALFASRRSRDS